MDNPAALPSQLRCAEPHFVWNIISLISMLNVFLGGSGCLWQERDKSSHAAARSTTSAAALRERFQKNLNSLQASVKVCVSRCLLLGFTPGRWRGDILPSGSHCSGLAVTADVWLRTEVKMAVRVWEGSEVSLCCCWCPGLFSTLSRCWQHRTSPAYSSRVQEDSSFQDTGGHACSSLEVISLFSSSQCIIRWQGRPGLCAPRRDGWSSVFHSGHGDWLLLINPLNDFKGKLICPQSPEDTAVSRSPVAKIETKPLCPFRYIWPLTP